MIKYSYSQSDEFGGKCQRGEEMEGMTDKQFNGFLRLVIKDLNHAVNLETKEDIQTAVKDVMKTLQDTLED